MITVCVSNPRQIFGQAALTLWPSHIVCSFSKHQPQMLSQGPFLKDQIFPDTTHLQLQTSTELTPTLCCVCSAWRCSGISAGRGGVLFCFFFVVSVLIFLNFTLLLPADVVAPRPHAPNKQPSERTRRGKEQ